MGRYDIRVSCTPINTKTYPSNPRKVACLRNSRLRGYVKDKGRRLIGLLIGPPGVGKILSAEAIAGVVGRPLYMLSSGELGDKPNYMDGNLKNILELARIWGAVLLLDEADVFLSKRDDISMERNAIVSILL